MWSSLYIRHRRGQIIQTNCWSLRRCSMMRCASPVGPHQSLFQQPLNHGQFTTLVSLDLRAAFDTVWHDGVVFKMGRLGFSAFLSKLILSFLSGRSFSVKHGTYVSPRAEMPSGTPQGSVCSPILFNLFMSDVPKFVLVFENMENFDFEAKKLPHTKISKIDLNSL